MRLIDADALKADIMLQAAILREVKGKSKLVRISDIVESEFITQIDKMPTIEERKTGKWRYSRNISSISYSDMMITCDQCGYTKERSHGDVFNFCPSCGARMERDYENKGDDN